MVDKTAARRISVRRATGPGSNALRLIRGPRLATALGHELVELDLVLGVPQAIEECFELALLLFEPTEGFVAVLVKGTVAARTLVAASAPPLGGCLHAPHPLLHSVQAPLPAIAAAVCPACHSSTPYEIPEKHETERPEQDEADDRQPDPCRLADVVQTRREIHCRLDVNVCNIHICTAPDPVKRNRISAPTLPAGRIDRARANKPAPRPRVALRRSSAAGAGRCRRGRRARRRRATMPRCGGSSSARAGAYPPAGVGRGSRTIGAIPQSCAQRPRGDQGHRRARARPRTSPNNRPARHGQR